MKIFPTVKKTVVVQQVSAGGEVTGNRLAAEVREAAHRAADMPAAVGSVRESNRRSVETVIAGLLTLATETAKRTVETALGAVTGRAAEGSRRAIDSAAMVGAVSDAGRRAAESARVEVGVLDLARKAAVSETATTTGRATETAKRAIEAITAAIVAGLETARRASESAVVNVTLNGYANANVSTSGWTVPAQALGNVTADAALLTATSSGTLGTTSNTTNGTMVVGFADPVLSDLTIQTATLNVERAVVSSGTVPIGQAVNVSWEYSFNGTTWTPITTAAAAVAKSVVSLNIAAALAGNWANVNALQVRATGSVTSGTGLSAQMQAQFHRCWLALTASKAY